MKKKICVIGAGKWGRNHIRTCHELDCLAGIVESNPVVAGELGEKYPHAQIFTDFKEAANQAFDGFSVVTPAETHFYIAHYLLEKGNHVLVEKPMALTVHDASVLQKSAEKHGVRLMVGHVLLFHPAIRKIKELIDSGKIGKLQYLYSNRLNLGTVRKEENILWSFAPHDISLFQFLIGKKPEEIVSRGGAFLQPAIHDSTLTILKYPDNIVGHIFVSWLHPFKEHRLVVIGSKGMVSFDDSSKEKQLLYYEKGIDFIQGEPIKRDGPTERIDYDPCMPLTEEIRYFIEHMDSDDGSINDGQSGVDVLEILEKASSSLLVGKEFVGGKDTLTSKNKPFFIHPTAILDDKVRVGEGSRIYHFTHVQSNATIGKGCTLGQNVNVGNNVRIGNFVKIQNNVSVYEGVELEDYVFCGPSMVFTNVLDPRCEFPQRGSEFYQKTLVRRGASIGANATVVCGNTVGRYAFIGAGSVVTKDVPDYALMVGVPAIRAGWMSRHGARLPNPDSEGIMVCPKSGLKYSEVKAGVLRCLDQDEDQPFE